MNLTVSRKGAGTRAISTTAYVNRVAIGTVSSIGLCFLIARKMQVTVMIMNR